MGTWIIARLTFREASRRKIALTGFLLGLAFVLLFSVGFFYINQQRLANMPFQSAIPMDEYLQYHRAGRPVRGQFFDRGHGRPGYGRYPGGRNFHRHHSISGYQAYAPQRDRAGQMAGLCDPFGALRGFDGGWDPGERRAPIRLQPLPNLLAGLGLMFLAALVVMTITIACSSRFSTMATGGLVIGLYGLAFVGSWVEQMGSLANSPAAVQVGIVSSLLMPSEALWRRAAFEMTAPLTRMVSFGPFSSASVPSPAMIIYGGLYLLVALVGGRANL